MPEGEPWDTVKDLLDSDDLKLKVRGLWMCSVLTERKTRHFLCGTLISKLLKKQEYFQTTTMNNKFASSIVKDMVKDGWITELRPTGGKGVAGVFDVAIEEVITFAEAELDPSKLQEYKLSVLRVYDEKVDGKKIKESSRIGSDGPFPSKPTPPLTQESAKTIALCESIYSLINVEATSPSACKPAINSDQIPDDILDKPLLTEDILGGIHSKFYSCTAEATASELKKYNYWGMRDRLRSWALEGGLSNTHKGRLILSLLAISF